MVKNYLQRFAVLGAALALGLTTGCSSMNNTQKGAGIGGAIGAGVGTVVGAATGNPRTGLAAGTLIGGGIGALVGNDVDKQEKEQAELRQAALESQPIIGPFSLQEVIDLSKQGVSDDVIINYIRQSKSTYHLSPQDLGMLKENKVSDRVVNEMVNSQSRPRVAIQQARQTVVIQEPPPVIYYERPYWGPHYHYQRPVYIAPPPPAFGVGVVIRK